MFVFDGPYFLFVLLVIVFALLFFGLICRIPSLDQARRVPDFRIVAFHMPSTLTPVYLQFCAAVRRVLPEMPYARLRLLLSRAALIIAALTAVFSPIPFRAWHEILLLGGLALAVSLLAVPLPNSRLTTYPGIPIFVAMIGLFGASTATLATVICTVAHGFVSLPASHRFRLKPYVTNISIQVITVGTIALLYALLEHICFPKNGVKISMVPGWGACFVLCFCSFGAFMVNALLTTTFISSHSEQRWDIVWHNNYRWQLPSAIMMSPVGLLTALLYGEHRWYGIAFVIVPMFALRMGVLTYERRMVAYRQGVDLLGRVMQEAHPYTHGHLHRVARWARKIAEEMRLPAASMQFIEDAAILHDIGKVAVDDRVLNKVGKLTDDDWSMIRRHPVTGAELVIRMSVMGRVGHWIRHHHERPDGQGYPDGLGEDDIPIESSIISVVDAFDAMVGGPAKEDQRPYRQPMAQDAAIAELRRHAGTQFQAEVVKNFIAILEREQKMEAKGEAVGAKPAVANDSLWSSPLSTSAAYSHSA